MKKRRLCRALLWLALCMVLLCACALSSAAAEDHAHAYILLTNRPATCTSAGCRILRCTICGETNIRDYPALGHQFDTAPWEIQRMPTCSSEGRLIRMCQRCGAVEFQNVPKNGEHQFREVMFEQPATCTEPGRRAIQECALCGLQTGGEEIPPVGHNAVGAAWVVRQEANCLGGGQLVRYCNNGCGVIVERLATERGTHPADYINSADACIAVAAVPATCTEYGYGAVYQCPICHETKGGERISPSHSWGEWQTTVAGSCTEEKREQRVCAVCGETQSRSAGNGHQWGEPQELVAPSCTTTGLISVQCVLCGEMSTIQVPPLAHEWGEEQEIPATCEADGQVFRKCTRCEHRKIERQIPATGHNTENVAWEQKVAATCVDNGLVVRRCTVCGQEAESLETPATGAHTWQVTVEKKPATCTEKGNTESQQCAVCGAVEEGEEIAPLGHDTLGMSWEAVTPATCAREGELGLRCARCNAVVETKTAEKTSSHTDSEGYFIDLRSLEPIVPEVIPTCTQPGAAAVYQCPTCGATIGGTVRAALGHEWSAWEQLSEGSCTVEGQKRRVCAVCGLTDNQSSGFAHTWQEERVEPDCESAGTENRVCQICGTVENDVELPPLGHNVGDEVYTLEATCVSEGRLYQRCARCGKEVVLRAFPATGEHVWTLEMMQNATCIQEGARILRCEICGKEENRSLPVMGHQTNGEYWEYRREATCAREGQMMRRCARCGEYVEFQAIEKNENHEWRRILFPTSATCIREGAKAVFECAICGAQRGGEATPALGHDMRLTRMERPTCTQDGLNTYACSRCGLQQTEVQPAAHTWGGWQTVENGRQRVCEICGETQTEAGSSTGDCPHYNVQGERILEPSCMTKGLIMMRCNTCGAIVDQQEIPELGHLFSDETRTVPATCVSDGKVLSVCSRCGHVADTGHVLLATGVHSWELAEEGRPATCTEGGVAALQQCAVCGIQKGGEVIPALGHDLSADWEVILESTCVTQGMAQRSCPRCGFILERVQISTNGEHDFQEETAQIAPTCTEAGATAVQVCSVCGFHKGGEPIPAAHQWGIWHNLQTAACDVTGLRRHTCKICGEAEEETVNFAHQWQETVTTEPTCVTAGVVTRVCALCNATENGELPATGRHAYEWQTLEATCAADGYIREICNNCGNISTVIPLSATGEHGWMVESEAMPTCTEGGSRVLKCSICGLTQEKPLPAYGHTLYGMEWMIGREATCEKEGRMLRECERCGEIVDTMTTEALGHDWQTVTPGGAASCTEDGVSAVERCGRCGLQQGGELLPALGHDIVVTLIAPATATEDGSERRVCSRCDLDKIRILPATGATLSLPARITEVAEEAFAGTAVRSVAVPSGVTAIRAKAFENCSRLVAITMPDSVTSIADDAFIGCDSLWFLCESDNAAAQYARSHGIDIIIE